MAVTDLAAQAIANAFVSARNGGRSLSAFPGAIPATLADAYRVQDAAIALVGGHAPGNIGGWKVGRIPASQAARYGADRLAGPILARAISIADDTNRTSLRGHTFVGGFGAAEAEFLLRIGHPVPEGKTHFSLDQAAELIGDIHVGIEIASSPLATINDLGPPVVVADFGNNNGLIIGPRIENWRLVGLTDLSVALLIDGREVGRGSAASFPDGPIGSVRFLLELLAARKITVPEGTWISSGAITGVHDVVAGQRVEARFGDTMLSVECRIANVARTDNSLNDSKTSTAQSVD